MNNTHKHFGLFEFQDEICGVDLVCYLEYIFPERGSVDSYGLPSEPDVLEDMVLVFAYIAGTQIDVSLLLSDHVTSQLETAALKEIQNDDR